MTRYSAMLIAFFCAIFSLNAQNNTIRQKVGVLNLDTKGFAYDPVQAGNIARLELEKLDIYDVMDRYDIDYLLEKDNTNAANCYGKLCLVDIAKKIKADKMLTGGIEILSERIVVSLRLIDVQTSSVEKSQVVDFLNVKDQVQNMIGMTMKKMFKVAIDENLFNQLSKNDAYNSAINLPNEEKVNLSGPRMGLAIFSGENASILKTTASKGGYDMVPVSFQFGYQMEVQYIGQGNFQALAEFIPMVTGLDQGKIIPSMTILNGLRDNRLGIEFAFGPTFILTKKADGYFENGVWRMSTEWDIKKGQNPNEIISRTDSRGVQSLGTGFVFALGKTFRSGRLNIPVNVYMRPDYKNGSQYGISFGFNARNKR